MLVAPAASDPVEWAQQMYLKCFVAPGLTLWKGFGLRPLLPHGRWPKQLKQNLFHCPQVKTCPKPHCMFYNSSWLDRECIYCFAQSCSVPLFKSTISMSGSDMLSGAHSLNVAQRWISVRDIQSSTSLMLIIFPEQGRQIWCVSAQSWMSSGSCWWIMAL